MKGIFLQNKCVCDAIPDALAPQEDAECRAFPVNSCRANGLQILASINDCDVSLRIGL